MKSRTWLYAMQAGLQRFAPLLCLVGTLGTAALLHFGTESHGHVVAFAQATPEAIAPTEMAKVMRLDVQVGDEVEPGQIVATLDTTTVDAEIALADAQRVRVEAAMRAEQTLLARRLDVDLETLEREAALQREDQLKAKAQVKALEGEVSRVKHLVDDHQAIYDDLARLDLQRATVSAVAAEKPKTLQLLAKQIKAAKERRKEINEDDADLAEKFAADLRVAERSIEQLKQRRAGYFLRATQRGRVAAIEKRPGEVAAAGEAIVRLVSNGGRVVACVPERVALGIREGDPAKLWIRGQSGTSLRGKTVILGPLVTELPARCWVSPKVPMWGREITVELDNPVDVLAGQAFDVVFEPAKAPPAAPPKAAPPGNVAASPLPMKMPSALASRTRFEPSGILAQNSDGRYLVVSDDTGRDGDEGVPWIFAMSKDGVLQSEPVPVHGVEELSDVEAIAAGDAGEIYLLSSQSYSKKGKRKPARTALLRLRKDGSGFRVDAAVHLAELLDADTVQATALGLPDGTRNLDIEGLTARGGSLYLGLKAPLDDQGKALIWRIQSPAALFEGKSLANAGASIYARARVDVEVDGKPTPGGISDLFFLPDGKLALTSTPSTADGDAGALWRIDAPESGTSTPALVKKYPGLKPEGITQSLSPDKLMVVFDTGGGAPLFEEIPWMR